MNCNPYTQYVEFSFADFSFCCSSIMMETTLTTFWKPFNRYCLGIIIRALSTTNSPAISEFRPTFENVSLLLSRGHLEGAISLFRNLNPPYFPHTYAQLFQACARHDRLDLGRALHRHMLIHEPTNPIDLYTTNHLVNMYAKCGDLSRARKLFDEMPQKNFVTWTSLISGYSQHGKVDECFGMFCMMVSHCRPNDFAYTSVLSICDGFCGRQVHAIVLKTGFCACVYVANALITMHWRSREVFCRNTDNDTDEEAWKVFKGMEFRNLVTWNAMIAGFQEQGQCIEAMTAFIAMCRDGVGFDRATVVSVVSAFWGSEDEKFSVLKCCLQLHGVSIKTGFVFDVLVVTALLNAYSRLGGEVDDCYQLFSETNKYRDIVLWTGIMTAFAERNPEEALMLFNCLCREGLKPDCYAFSTVSKACGRFVTEKHALAVYCQAIKAGCTNVIVLQNALIHAFSRCGSVVLAREVFDGMSIRDIVSWNSILKAYALHGQGKQSLDIFKHMDVEPDATTFTAILSACSHSGMVEEGTEIFDTMFEKYGVVPQLDHYASMVDAISMRLRRS